MPYGIESFANIQKAINALSPSSRVLKIDSCKLNATVLLPICFRYPCCIGVGRFRILGGGGGGGGKV